MEKKMNHKSKSIQDILPLDLIQRILLRVPVRHLARLKCVSKRWYSLISDPHFAELHFHRSPAATNASVFMGGGSLAYFVYLDSLFTDNNDALQVKKVSLPFKMKKLPSDFELLGSCRGFVLLHGDPHFLVVWNPLTGSGKRISYSHIVSRCKHKGFRLPSKFHLYGFGYDAFQDDYLVVVAWQDKDDHYHFDCFSLRTNSWINLDAALSKPLDVCHRNSCGLFLNGAIHWVPYPLTAYRDAIIIFDTKERTFSRISGPEQPVVSACTFPTLALLGGCLALYYHNNDSCNTHIWVMKEYKVLSSWTLYQIPCKDFRPLCLSSNMDIIGRGYTLYGTIGYFIYNVREDLLKHFNDHYCWLPLRATDPLYTESLLPLPGDIKEKDKKKKMKKSAMEIPCLFFRPLCLSNNGDIIGEQFLSDKVQKKKFLIYNVGGELLPRVKYLCSAHNISATDTMYTESLLPLPRDIKDKDNKNMMKNRKRKENGHEVHHECFEQLDVAKD
ncbi:hypothetical protein Ahy_A04g017324 [Arachis hypogaea]|uniref:F-box domain-containing protein n=1 Tax=Arachis hypogaea TaxID=3818 RepID=A0A445DAQ8_ARAHY|nr:hypothetical protein Ahy_A04g017324 [Arachis hypogaea]